mmetsp:Transcript_24515/g.61694  ORF Transcript_24515/g.61694 Transcript_24515/m.61694 type:complete len:1090 (+) Transcript_24515:99-3368(+)|eukprot:CAMPEP_0178986830 /NCGR_PEP_ID=MMETSP0795-20121207/2922_1 /TAXON_ID=88552 /ORGANISM="Amoebophrya sp., Strain Ameob2" /LENGTH=1089 /DNA_ID=CAMNT_0020677935 /DNA_START=43 /DNA_END=3312 /DNA_ORIENTATION=+
MLGEEFRAAADIAELLAPADGVTQPLHSQIPGARVSAPAASSRLALLKRKHPRLSKMGTEARATWAPGSAIASAGEAIGTSSGSPVENFTQAHAAPTTVTPATVAAAGEEPPIAATAPPGPVPPVSSSELAGPPQVIPPRSTSTNNSKDSTSLRIHNAVNQFNTRQRSVTVGHAIIRNQVRSRVDSGIIVKHKTPAPGSGSYLPGEQVAVGVLVNRVTGGGEAARAERVGPGVGGGDRDQNVVVHTVASSGQHNPHGGGPASSSTSTTPPATSAAAAPGAGSESVVAAAGATTPAESGTAVGVAGGAAPPSSRSRSTTSRPPGSKSKSKAPQEREVVVDRETSKGRNSAAPQSAKTYSTLNKDPGVSAARSRRQTTSDQMQTAPPGGRPAASAPQQDEQQHPAPRQMLNQKQKQKDHQADTSVPAGLHHHQPGAVEAPRKKNPWSSKAARAQALNNVNQKHAGAAPSSSKPKAAKSTIAATADRAGSCESANTDRSGGGGRRAAVSDKSRTEPNEPRDRGLEDRLGTRATSISLFPDEAPNEQQRRISPKLLGVETAATAGAPPIKTASRMFGPGATAAAEQGEEKSAQSEGAVIEVLAPASNLQSSVSIEQGTKKFMTGAPEVGDKEEHRHETRPLDATLKVGLPLPAGGLGGAITPKKESTTKTSQSQTPLEDLPALQSTTLVGKKETSRTTTIPIDTCNKSPNPLPAADEIPIKAKTTPVDVFVAGRGAGFSEFGGAAAAAGAPGEPAQREQFQLDPETGLLIPAREDARIQCPHCHRNFNEEAAARHIPRCKDIKHRPAARSLQKKQYVVDKLGRRVAVEVDNGAAPDGAASGAEQAGAAHQPAHANRTSLKGKGKKGRTMPAAAKRSAAGADDGTSVPGAPEQAQMIPAALDSQWGQVQILLTDGINAVNSGERIAETTGRAKSGLQWVHDVEHYAKTNGLMKGKLSRMLLPFNKDTDAKNQANVKSDLGSPELDHTNIPLETRREMVREALNVRRFLRVKVADDADMDLLKDSLSLILAFFQNLSCLMTGLRAKGAIREDMQTHEFILEKMGVPFAHKFREGTAGPGNSGPSIFENDRDYFKY